MGFGQDAISWTIRIMGWGGSLGRKVGRLLSDASEPLLRSFGSPRSKRSSSEEASCNLLEENERRHKRTVSNVDSNEEFQGPDTSSLTAFLYSFLRHPDKGLPCADSPDCIPENSHENPSDCYSKLPEDALDAKRTRVGNGGRKPQLDINVNAPNNAQSSPRLKLPSMTEESILLTEGLRDFIYPSLPTLVQGCQWVLLYSTLKDGISLLTLYRKSATLSEPFLLVTGDADGAIFGALLTAPLKPSSKRKYQGSSQTFVYTDVSGKPELFRSTGLNHYFFLCTNDALAIGGGGHFALYLESDLLSGSSGACNTFGNSCLAHQEEFIVKNVELWGFAHRSRYTPKGSQTVSMRW